MDNVETATEMLAYIITYKQISSYTESTYAAAVNGHRVARVALQSLFCKQQKIVLFLCFIRMNL
jgi:hypothetical protein